MGDEAEDLLSLRFVGEATATALAGADLGPDDLYEKRVGQADLVEAGVNGGVAARIRREYSLPWSVGTGGEDLDRRAGQVRGLGESERAWVAASAGDWQDAEPGTDDRRRGPDTAAESEWREASRPEPVTVLDGVHADDATALAEAGIISVRSLAVSDADRVARSLEMDRPTVVEWRDRARNHREDADD